MIVYELGPEPIVKTWPQSNGLRAMWQISNTPNRSPNMKNFIFSSFSETPSK